MTHEEISLRTKNALAASLKKFLEKKPLNKITITEIIKDCNMNRNTFYYHFEDIYALFKWTLESETIDIIKRFSPDTTFTESISFAIDYIKSNQHMLASVYDTLGLEELKRFLKHDFESLMENHLNIILETLSVSLPSTYRSFLIQFYSSAIANTLISWFSGEISFSDKEMTAYLSQIMENTLPIAVKSYIM